MIFVTHEWPGITPFNIWAMRFDIWCMYARATDDIIAARNRDH